MKIRLYNTLRRKKEVFRPLRDKRVNLFVCGPTVYDSAHVGHARTYLVYDILARYLRALGYKVFYLENITDVSDKIINRAKKTGKKPETIARKFEREFLSDMRALGIRSVTRYARANDFIPQIIRQVARLIKKGFAYATPAGNVYFRVRKFKDYGKLSHQNINKVSRLYKRAMLSEGEIDPSEGKKEEIDFALWKASAPREPKWPSPWGWGRPGWHIEDTAISEKFFGTQYDIHGGGLDLIFPHHECEIAQQEAASGRSPFVRYWLHTGHLKVFGEKMSKSLGNFIAIRELLKKTRPEVFRLLVAQTHYRQPINYTARLLSQTQAAHERLVEFVLKLKEPPLSVKFGDKVGTRKPIAKARKDFYDALADDFNTPRAVASIFALVNRINPLLDKGGVSSDSRKKITSLLKEVDQIFGIIGKVSKPKISALIQRLVSEREKLRKQKKWQEADVIRRKIQALGWQVEDTASGPRLKRQ